MCERRYSLKKLKRVAGTGAGASERVRLTGTIEAHEQRDQYEGIKRVGLCETEQILPHCHGNQDDRGIHRQHPAVPCAVTLLSEPTLNHGVGTAHDGTEYKANQHPNDAFVHKAEE